MVYMRVCLCRILEGVSNFKGVCDACEDVLVSYMSGCLCLSYLRCVCVCHI